MDNEYNYGSYKQYNYQSYNRPPKKRGSLSYRVVSLISASIGGVSSA